MASQLLIMSCLAMGLLSFVFILNLVLIHRNMESNVYPSEPYKGMEPLQFEPFIHYKQDWSILTNTTWSIPSPQLSAQHTRYHGIKRVFSNWEYDILDFPIVPFFSRSNATQPRDSNMITIVTSSSLNRLGAMLMAASNWNGFISLAVYVTLEEFEDNSYVARIASFVASVEQTTSAVLDIHLLFETERVHNTRDYGQFGALYPINHLRNVALQCATTKYVLLVDADFIPSSGFHDAAIANYRQLRARLADGPAPLALAIPAFELAVNRSNEYAQRIQTLDDLPLSKQEMVASHLNRGSQIYHVHRCRDCHAPTNYAEWYYTDQSYPVDYVAGYEPYVLIERVGAHRYDARFRGYGLNKIFHIRALIEFDHYTMGVSSDCFLYHVPHLESRDRKQFFAKEMKTTFKHWLQGLNRLVTRDFVKGYDVAGYILT